MPLTLNAAVGDPAANASGSSFPEAPRQRGRARLARQRVA